ncbi:LRR receptor-like serine/threonine-protein kinase ERL1 [Durio zibethinus]|uniref:LRR receptor-like serine/threonine-protein kinase ERL1 n=1 Tax=Durio zibethinus TaxID=66656 RepID=A0A6P5Z8H8_DURZI|nr:LRR receptor-like serine/threonine-protein kinase ERL1 [Durio zibethinus]
MAASKVATDYHCCKQKQDPTINREIVHIDVHNYSVSTLDHLHLTQTTESSEQRCMEEERDALLQIKASINSLGGTAFSSWYEEDRCQASKTQATWEAESAEQLNKESFSSLPEEGGITVSLFLRFVSISHLEISYNAQLELETESQTWFPSFNLNELNLAGCNLRKIPSFLSTQINLKTLDLSDNLPVGKIPSWLMHSTTSKLRVGGNKLSGPFPRIFRNISSKLTSLNVSDDSFDGPLPEDINLIFPELFYIDASFNDGIPPSFGRLKRLRFLDLSYNKFHGGSSLLMTSNMSSLEHLNLEDNNLRGYAIPRNSSLPNLKILVLGKNDFTGTFQDSLSWSLSQSSALN